jgi:hypothetical protein
MLFEVKKGKNMNRVTENESERLAVLRCRFDERLKEREEHLVKIAALEAVSFVCDQEFQKKRVGFLTWYRAGVQDIDKKLNELRRELGIETLTSNEGAL